MIIKIDNRLRNVAAAPVLLGNVGNRRFYEHPVKGDEAPMLERIGEGQYVSTDYWEMEDIA